TLLKLVRNHMITEGKIMQILKINDNGTTCFSLNGLDWTPIDRIGKEDILKLLDLCVEKEIVMDEYDEERIKNPAHNIIYKNIYLKLGEFYINKQSFIDEVEGLYKEALETYKK
ncbi:hypothetical protein, partial [Vibrio parahaemolyticus]|uniref:hypothetical protein n=2 Tax=Vibrionaceae TaxID=641 RepID=UPI001C610075